jgi:DNA-binding transcriptional ArsR family regulator
MNTSDGATRLRDIAVRDPRISAAIDEPMRAMILDALATEALSVGEIHRRLEDRGVDRTENTVRHHVNELRDAGLVEVARFEEGRGGTTKYYTATTIVLSYSIPESAAADLAEMTEALQPAVGDAIETLEAEFGDRIREVVADMDPCEHCRDQKYEDYLLLTAIRRAFVRERWGPAAEE